MIPNGRWHWFGLRVMPDWHVAYRVVTVEDDGDLCRCAVWHKGESGEVWYRRIFESHLPFEQAIGAARKFVEERCRLYETVEETKAPETWEYSATWWADFFGVAEDADNRAVRKAFQAKLKAVHPDMHPGCSDAEREEFTRLCRIVVEAYDRFRSERGIP